MAPQPKRKHSTRRSGKRVNALKKVSLTLAICPQCKTPKLPHIVCASCGYYNEKLTLPVKLKKSSENKP